MVDQCRRFECEADPGRRDFKSGQYVTGLFAGDLSAAALGADLPDPLFLDQIPLVSAWRRAAHYHVAAPAFRPLALSTYRGS